MAPRQEVYLEADKENVMSVEIPKFEYRQRHRMKMISIPTDMHLHPVTWMML